MKASSLSQLADDVLLQALAALVVSDRTTSAALLAHLGEVETRRLHAPAGCSSMFVYCVRELRMSEDIAYKRLAAARIARQFPFVLAAIADGRLHVTGIALLVRHLKERVTEEVLRAAMGQSRRGLERLIATISPRPDVPARITAMQGQPPCRVSPVPGQVTLDESQLRVSPVPGQVTLDESQLRVSPVPGRVTLDGPDTELVMLSPDRYKLETMLDQEANDLLARSQELEGLPPGASGAAEALKRALRARVAQLEKRKFAATERPRPTRSDATRNPRSLPADVRRAVRERDGDRCTFVGNNGHRCDSRRVQFDHVVPVARGGKSTIGNLRLLCRTHNQHAAEQEFGTEFVRAKRERAQLKAAAMREKSRARAAAALAEVSAAVDRAQAPHAGPA